MWPPLVSRGLNRALALLDERFGPGPFALGESFSVVDLHLFVFLLWMQRPALDGKLDLRPNFEAARARLAQRRSVSRAMAAEGLISAT